MGVPNTSTFTLQDVVNTVNPTTDDLVDCFADAVSSKFDSSYSGSKNALLNFRNYDSSGLTPFYNSSFTLPWGAPCGETTQNLMYHTGTTPGPQVGDTVYKSNGTTLDASTRRKYFPQNSVELAADYTTNSSGIVATRVNCP